MNYRSIFFSISCITFAFSSVHAKGIDCTGVLIPKQEVRASNHAISAAVRYYHYDKVLEERSKRESVGGSGGISGIGAGKYEGDSEYAQRNERISITQNERYSNEKLEQSYLKIGIEKDQVEAWRDCVVTTSAGAYLYMGVSELTSQEAAISIGYKFAKDAPYGRITLEVGRGGYLNGKKKITFDLGGSGTLIELVQFERGADFILATSKLENSSSVGLPQTTLTKVVKIPSFASISKQLDVQKIFLSNIEPEGISNVNGGLGLDSAYWRVKENGSVSSDNRYAAITITGTTYRKGLSQHAPANGTSRVTYIVPHGMKYFNAVVGLISDSDKKPCNGSGGTTRFRALVNGSLSFSSKANFSTSKIALFPVEAGDQLVLETDNAGDGNACDHSAWANAHFSTR